MTQRSWADCSVCRVQQDRLQVIVLLTLMRERVVSWPKFGFLRSLTLFDQNLTL